MTTFDNRQWMDIRGVGSGAAAIEYVERGAFLERNVILHEYVHLFHGRVLTDAENRKVRALYYNAMKEKRTLDYYSQNNESEYFAQTYPAYFEPVKVHPLDFKSMNTVSDLKTKDPEMYQFLDQLVKKEKAYLAGDKQSMASNWAQVYINLSNKVKQKDPQLAEKYLDSAIIFDQKYLPAFLSLSQLKIDKKDFTSAEEWLKKAMIVDPKFAPIYVSYAGLFAARFAANEIDQKLAVQEQIKYLKQAFQLEVDYQELARVNLMLREMYRSNGMVAEAILTAQEYAKSGATISTYLRDRRDDATAYAAVLQSYLGYQEPVKVLKKLVEQKPQNFEYRNMYADALAINREYNLAIQTLKEAQRILNASNNGRDDYNLRIAEFYHAIGDKNAADQYIKLLLNKKPQLESDDQLRYIRLLTVIGNQEQSKVNLASVSPKGDPFYEANYLYTQGKVLELTGKNTESALLYEKAILTNPYLFNAYADLLSNYISSGQQAKADALKLKLAGLKIKPGPGYQNLNP